MKITVNVIGATGLTGRELVRQLLKEPMVGKIRIFSRRKSGFDDLKIEELLTDFDKVESWKSLVTGDVLFSCLGTTLSQAGSKDAQYKVDYTFQYRFAEAAAANGVSSYALVSSAGADSGSRLFYPRIKGELDEAVGKLPFKKCIILRPSILDGEREKKRLAEHLSNHIMKLVTRWVLRKYRPVSGAVVARAMIRTVMDSEVEGYHIYTLDEVFGAAGN
jgi:uncharacterized protein YbjT (DUF2867 family)